MMPPLSDITRFLIDFNVHAVASALGLPIPDAAVAQIYGVDLAALNAYQSEIDAELALTAQPYQMHPGVGVLQTFAKTTGRVLCIGDSITTYRRSYAHILRHLLTGVEVVNRGFSGYTSTLGLELTYTQFLQLQPGVVLIKYGVNDCKQFGGGDTRPLVSHDEYAENLRRIVLAFQQHTPARIAVITPTPVIESVVNHNPDVAAMRLTWANTVLHDYAGLALQVAAQTGALPVDLRGTFGDPPDAAYFCPDGLHPNADGQRLMLERVLECFAVL